jgi:hypothetical protein
MRIGFIDRADKRCWSLLPQLGAQAKKYEERTDVWQ